MTLVSGDSAIGGEGSGEGGGDGASRVISATTGGAIASIVSPSAADAWVAFMEPRTFAIVCEGEHMCERRSEKVSEGVEMMGDARAPGRPGRRAR